jgi:Ca2+-binding RTX toxin-like protein
MTLTLGAASMAAGLATVTGGTGTNSVTVGAGHTSALTVALVAGTDTMTASASAAAITVTALADDVDSSDTITGGSGTGDTLTITNENATGLVAADLANVTGFETFNFATDVLSTAFTVDDGMVASGATAALDGTALTTTVFTADLSAETDGAYTVTAGGTGAHVVTLGNKNDSYTSTSTGVDTVVATAGTNTISTGAGNDIITGGTGADSMTGGAGDDSFRFITANLTLADTIAGGAGDDTLQLTTDGSTVVDADFTLATSVETLTTTAGARMTLATIGTLAEAAGLTTVNFADTTAVDKLVVGSGFTSALTVDLDNDTTLNTLDASAYTGTLTVTAADGDLDTTASTLTGGTGTADEIQITAGGNAIASADLANVSGFEKITAVGYAGGLNITLNDANIAAGETLTIDATSFDDDVLTVDASNETSGSLVITADGTGDHQITLGSGNDTYTSTSSAGEDVTATAGNNTISTGGGADIIIAGTDDDNITAGSGDDTVRFATANLTSGDTVDGGAGTDSISMTNDATVVDGDFTNMSNVETLTTTGTVNLTATLGAQALEAGIVTVTLADDNVTDTVTIGSGYTGTITVQLDSDTTNADVINATSSSATLIVEADQTEIDTTAATITGGTGTSDEIKVATANADDTLQLGSTTLVEKLTTTGVAGTGSTLTLTTVDALVASGKTFTIDVTSLDDDILTFDGSAELDGTFTITADGTGAHVVTLGNKNDTYTSTSTGIDTVTATAGVNTISTGAGADVITGGTGVDTITGGAGADVFTYTGATLSNSSNTDSITDWTSGTDKLAITLDYSAQVSAVTVNATVGTARAGVTVAQDNLSGERGQVIYDTTNSNVLINLNNDNLITTLDHKIGLNAAATAANTVVEGDINFTITGGSGFDTIVAGGGADTISTGSGGGNVTAGAGADALTFAAGIDHATFSDSNGSDTITAFDVNQDFLNFDGLTGVSGNGIATAADATIVDPTDGAIYVHADGDDGTGADSTATQIASYTSMADVAEFLEASYSVAADENYVFVINDLVGADVYAYSVAATAATLTAAMVTLVGTLNNIGGTALDVNEIS